MRKATYEVRVEGQVAGGWSEFFDGLVVRHVRVSRGVETAILIPAADAARLNGLLSYIGNLGLTLISVRRVKGATWTVGRNLLGILGWIVLALSAAAALFLFVYRLRLK